MTSIPITDVKQFMLKILTKDVFDGFDMVKMEVSGFCHFMVDGILHKEFYGLEEQEQLEGKSHARWEEIKPFALQMMKGNKTPLFFLIILKLSKKETEEIVRISREHEEDVTGLYLNVRYEHNQLMLTAGSARKSFTPDKTLDLEWEQWVRQFLKKHEIT